VSQSGDTMVLGGAKGLPTQVSADVSHGLIVVQRIGATVTTHLLATYWDTWPEVSADGSSVLWITGGQVFKYSGGTTTLVDDSIFKPAMGEEVWDFAVSPDGTEGAVLYRVNATSWRVLAASFTLGKAAPYLDKAFTGPVSANFPDTYAFVWS